MPKKCPFPIGHYRLYGLPGVNGTVIKLTNSLFGAMKSVNPKTSFKFSSFVYGSVANARKEQLLLCRQTVRGRLNFLERSD